LDADLIEQFSSFETPDISDQLNRLYALDPKIHCLTPDANHLCGSVTTVKLFPGDNLMVHKVLDIVKPGDVVMIAARSNDAAVLGDTICTKAKHRGVQGFIIDGLARDLPGMQEVGLPVFATGTSPVGPLHRGPGEINYPISCGGTVVSPGDIVVADGAGIVVIPRDIAAELLFRLKEYRATSQSYLASVQNGEFSNAWVDNMLANHDCEVNDAVEPAEVPPAANGGAPSHPIAAK
jgi:regulator of RNase E activity RraA